MMNPSAILDHNTQSISHLRGGNYSEASDLLNQVLVETRRYILQDASVSNVAARPGNSRKHHHEATISSELEETTGNFEIQVVDAMISGANGTANTTLSPYTRAFMVPVVPVTKVEKTAALMAFVYNVGLTFHLEALSMNESAVSRRLLAQAAKMYQSALRVAAKQLLEDGPCSGLECIMLAAANNYAHVYTEDPNAAEAAKGVSMVHSLLQEESVFALVPEEDYSFFAGNVTIFLESPLFSIAPAA